MYGCSIYGFRRAYLSFDPGARARTQTRRASSTTLHNNKLLQYYHRYNQYRFDRELLLNGENDRGKQNNRSTERERADATRLRETSGGKKSAVVGSNE